ncbi:Ig-like domain-containing protein, partial [Pseudoalteromonas sp. B137]
MTGGSDLEAGRDITVTFTDSDNNVHSVATQVGANGEWAVSAQTALSEGVFSVTVTATDAAGNSGSSTSTGETDYTGPTLIIDPLLGVLGIVAGVSGRSDLPAGSEITVTQELVGGGVAILGVTTTDANGDWNLIGLSISLLTLANISAEAQDAYGNSTTATLGWTDNTPPVLSVSVTALSNDSSPVVSGETDIGAGNKVIVTFTDKAGVDYVEEATVDSSGNFSVAVSAVLPEGSYSVTVVAVDDAGLVTEVSGSGIIDTTAPVLSIDALGTQGDPTPLISGTSTEPAGSKVSVTVTDTANTPYSYEATVTAGGTWSIEVTDGLVNGAFSVTVNASDSAGNPAVAVTSTGIINSSLPVIDITPLAVSNNTSPIIEGSSGLAENTVITLTVSQAGEADQVVTVTVDGNGDWTTQAGDISGLVEGNFNISVSAEDGVGNTITSSHSASIDLTDPLLSINSIETGNDTTPNVTGGSDLEAGRDITVTFTDSDNNVHSVATQVGANGEWAVSAQTALSEGVFSVTVTATDAAGNSGSSTSTGETDYTGPTLIIDPLLGVLGIVAGVSGRSDLPAGSEITVTQELVGGGVAILGVTTTDANGDWNLIGLSISLLTLANISAEAQDAYGNSTTATLGWTDNTPPVLSVSVTALSNDSSPVVSGETDIGAGNKVIVTFTDKAGVDYVEEATVDSSGNFSVAVSAVLPEGSYSVTVVAVDDAGLVTEVSGSGIIDTTAPVLSIDALGTQGDPTPLISGTSTEPAGSKVSVTVTDTANTPYSYEATVTAGGTWSIEVTDGLVNGAFSVTVNASDSAGNPAVAVTSTGIINSSLPVIDITPLAVSNNTSPIIEGSSGLAENTVITLTVSQAGEADQVVTVTVDGNGDWTTQAGDISGLVEGNFNISVSAEDGVGNTITSSHSASIDLTDPLLSINSIETGNDTTPNVTGGSDLEAGRDITVTFTDSDNNVHSVATQVGANGEWAVSAQTALSEGVFSVTVTATDAAGNSGSSTSTGETDYTGPTLIIDPLLGVLGIVAGVSGRSDLPAGSEITVTQELVGGGVAILGVTTTDANGDWNLIGLSISLLTLANISAEAQDAYGNSTTATLGWTDNTPPVLSVSVTALSNDSSPVVSGETDIGAGNKVIVTFTDKAGVDYVEEATVDSSGNFSVAVSAVLPEGSYSVTVVAVDDAGLVTEVSGSGIIDTTAPVLSIDALGTQGDPTPLISGTSTEPAGSKVSVTVTDTANTPYSYEATVTAGGTWSIEVTDGLVNGAFSVTVNASDSAGNPAVAVTSTGIINSSLPVIDITPLAVSNNTSPIIEGSSGLAENTVITLTVSQAGEADQVVTVTVDGNGDWTTQAGDISGLVEGNFNISVSAEDGVGNTITSSHSASIDL